MPNADWLRTIYFTLVLILTGLSGTAFGYFIAAMASNVSIALALGEYHVLALASSSSSSSSSSHAITILNLQYLVCSPIIIPPVPPTVMPMVLFSGLLVDSDTVPVFLSWLENLSLVRYCYQSLVILEFREWDITCPKNQLCRYQDYDSVLHHVGTTDEALKSNLAGLAALTFGLFVLGYIFLNRRLPKPKANKNIVKRGILTTL